MFQVTNLFACLLYLGFIGGHWLWFAEFISLLCVLLLQSHINTLVSVMVVMWIVSNAALRPAVTLSDSFSMNSGNLVWLSVVCSLMSAAGRVNEHVVSVHLIFLMALPPSPGYWSIVSPHDYSFLWYLKELWQRYVPKLCTQVLQLNGKLSFTDAAPPSAQLCCCYPANSCAAELL